MISKSCDFRFEIARTLDRIHNQSINPSYHSIAMVSEIPSSKWEIRARKEEKEAFKLDKEAHSFPIKEELFLEAAKIARKSARYFEFARLDTNDPLQQSINLANFNINIGNSYKSLGNFFYYSEQPTRAAKFFERAAKQYALADSQIPISLVRYVNIIQDSLAQQALQIL